MRASIPRQRGDQVPLSNSQKAIISGIARQAWTLLKQNGATDETEKEYRQRESIAAVGRRVSEALNGDFSALQAHFLANAGKTGRAFTSAMRAESNGGRQARFKIGQLLAKHKLTEAYASAICRDKFKTTLEAASEKQLWSIFFDCQRGMKSRQPGKTADQLMQEAEARFVSAHDDSIPY
jgi:hypothetical protein